MAIANDNQRLNTIFPLLILLEFRQFLNVQKEGREQWQATVAEAQRLQRELDRANQERSELEKNLFHARRLLENESKARRAAEADLDARVSIFSGIFFPSTLQNNRKEELKINRSTFFCFNSKRHCHK